MPPAGRRIKKPEKPTRAATWVQAAPGEDKPALTLTVSGAASRARPDPVFDRTWYGPGVLVERVEGFAAEAEWAARLQRDQLFERQLKDFGSSWRSSGFTSRARSSSAVFEERKAIATSPGSSTDEDWRNRQKWGAYEGSRRGDAGKDQHPTGPWCLVEGNDNTGPAPRFFAASGDLSKELDYRPANR